MCCKLPILSRFSRLALLALIVLNALDALTTWMDFQLGAQEGNPLAAPLIAHAGLIILLPYKAIVLLAALIGTLLLERLQARRVLYPILVFGLLYFLTAVLFNTIGLLLH